MIKKNRPKLGIYRKSRDVQVVETLWRYRVLRESTLHSFCFPTVIHRRKVQARLKKLRDEGYIGRPPSTIVHRDANDNYDPPYWVERLGVEEVLDGHPIDDEQKERLRVVKNLTNWKPHRLRHVLDVSDIRACLEQAVEQTPGVHLVAWYDEHDQHDRNPVLQAKVKIPYGETGRERSFTLCADACFVLENESGDKQDLFFVEIDEGTESGKKRWRDKVLAYIAYLKQGFERDFEFNGRDFRVLTVTRSRRGKEQGKRKEGLLKATFNVSGRGEFLFATFDQVMPEGMVTGDFFLTRGIWQRAREEDIKQKKEFVLYNELFV
ncbi:hypothetical protein COU79_03395 [Candidatus Peregrinibacteria bacterium CG10_big_fil_rev_8_21_14_0_10_54_7]|nr:MAG: hypothetical protein COU79_03395 [Candidatus Peregrinibacteria bacterium CG10_big_fil_rev_8_21_14_0_10_54_7]